MTRFSCALLLVPLFLGCASVPVFSPALLLSDDSGLELVRITVKGME